VRSGAELQAFAAGLAVYLRLLLGWQFTCACCGAGCLLALAAGLAVYLRLLRGWPRSGAEFWACPWHSHAQLEAALAGIEGAAAQAQADAAAAMARAVEEAKARTEAEERAKEAAERALAEAQEQASVHAWCCAAP